VDDFDRPARSPSFRSTEHCSGRGTMRSKDDLTYKLGEIIKASTNVQKSEQEVSLTHIVTEYEQFFRFV
jgi:DNA-directed RNA polymerase II subunit RPB1